LIAIFGRSLELTTNKLLRNENPGTVSTGIGIRDKKIPNTVTVLGILFHTVLGILFHEKNIPNTVTVIP
jgi:hypothetical protein